MAEQRRKIWIDGFQTRLALRIAFYFIFYQFAIWFLVIIERSIFLALEDMLGRDVAVYILLFLVGIVLLVGALFIYEAIKFSHRLVGPLVRFRKVFQAIKDGQAVQPIQLRQGDFLHELKDELNEMLQALEERGAVTLKPAPATAEKAAPAPGAAKLSGADA